MWKATTALEYMVQCYFKNIPAFKPEVGFETRFNVKAPSGDYMYIWKVTEVDPPKKLPTNGHMRKWKKKKK